LREVNLGGRAGRFGPVTAKKLHLTTRQKAALVAFLHTLTDERFLTDSKFSSPFKP
jgi:hypothetical protein